MKFSLSYVFFALAILLVSCATPTARVFVNLPARSSYNDIEILRTKPTRPYEVIAEFEVHGGNENSIKKTAASYGAEAVYVASYGSFFGGIKNELKSDNVETGVGREYLCTAIKYK